MSSEFISHSEHESRNRLARTMAIATVGVASGATLNAIMGESADAMANLPYILAGCGLVGGVIALFAVMARARCESHG